MEGKGTSKFKIKTYAKYLFTLIYCFIEKNLLNIKNENSKFIITKSVYFLQLF